MRPNLQLWREIWKLWKENVVKSPGINVVVANLTSSTLYFLAPTRSSGSSSVRVCDSYRLSPVCEAGDLCQVTRPILLIFSPLWLTQLRPTLLLSLPMDTLHESPGRLSWPAPAFKIHFDRLELTSPSPCSHSQVKSKPQIQRVKYKSQSLFIVHLNKPYDEVLGAAQFTESINVKICRNVSKVVKSCQKLSKVVKSCQKLSKVVKSCQKLSKVVISCHKLSKWS